MKVEKIIKQITFLNESTSRVLVDNFEPSVMWNSSSELCL